MQTVHTTIARSNCNHFGCACPCPQEERDVVAEIHYVDDLYVVEPSGEEFETEEEARAHIESDDFAAAVFDQD